MCLYIIPIYLITQKASPPEKIKNLEIRLRNGMNETELNLFSNKTGTSWRGIGEYFIKENLHLKNKSERY